MFGDAAPLGLTLLHVPVMSSTTRTALVPECVLVESYIHTRGLRLVRLVTFYDQTESVLDVFWCTWLTDI